jgi:hypothetical protein
MAFAQDRAMIQFGKSATCIHGFGKLLADFKDVSKQHFHFRQ